MGFSMIEMLIAMAVFLIVGSAAVRLFQTHVNVFTRQQNQSTLNFSLRNAVAQMQIDIVNAGNGFYTGADIAAWPVGVTIVNHDAGSVSCYDSTTNTYGQNCFDELNVISTDVAVPLAHPVTGGTCHNTANSSILFGAPTTGTLANLAAAYKKDDMLLLVDSTGNYMTTTKLTKDAQVTGAKVQFQHNPTGANGVNSPGDDPLLVSTTANNKLSEQFCDDDWIMKVVPVTYMVDTTDPTNPKLVRRNLLKKNPDGTYVQEVIADQIIGFKVGASIVNNDADYIYNAKTAVADGGYNSDWTQIKAVRLTLIGRTPPTTGSYRNDFDHGPYRVEAVSIVVNPRNLSLND